VTTKETHRGVIHEEEEVLYAVSSMQGWRVHMEDAHICETELYAEKLQTSGEDGDTLTAKITSGGSNENSGEAGEGDEDGIKTKVGNRLQNGSDEKSDDCGKNKKAKKDDSIDTAHKTVSNPNPLDMTMESSSGSATVSVSHEATATSSKATMQRVHLPRHSLFAVFDGHGGTYAAQYAGQNFCRVLSRQTSFFQYAQYVQQQMKLDEGTTKSTSEVLSPTQRAEMDRSGLELLEIALRDAFIEIDCEIYQTQNNASIANIRNNDDDNAVLPNREDGDSGTTAVVVVLTPQWIVCANAGDSRAIYSKNQHHIPLSYDHKPCDEAEEQRIIEAGGYVRAGRVEGDLAVSRGFGDFRFKEVETVLAATGLETSSGSRGRRASNNMISPGDQKVSPVPDIIVQNRNRVQDEFIILACDGIWDVQTNPECVALVAKIFREGESDLGLICEEVLDTCLELDSKDNMTVLIVKLPAQSIEEGGGGVTERRRLRDAAMTEEDS